VEIAKELESTNFGILCVTKENLTSPWILFEAGALAKSMQDGKVIPLLHDIDFKDVSGPLAQFQSKKAERPGVRELVLSLNKTAPTPVPDDQLEKLFVALWPQLEGQINAIPKSGASAKPSRTQSEILEELVSSVRGVELRVRDAMEDTTQTRRRRGPKRQQMFADLLLSTAYRIGDGPRDPVGILVIASYFKEDAPWVYELGLDAYRLAKSGKSKEAKNAHRRFVGAAEMMMHGPFADELGFDRRTLSTMLMEISALPYSPVEDEADTQKTTENSSPVESKRT
jgi:hypothetical protein